MPEPHAVRTGDAKIGADEDERSADVVVVEGRVADVGARHEQRGERPEGGIRRSRRAEEQSVQRARAGNA